MCTLALYFKVFEDYPIIVAANRDERYDRPSDAPGEIGRNPVIVAGRDLLAGGTWLGVNQYGLLVGILNRRSNNNEHKTNDFRSRGLLCLDLLGFKSAAYAEANLHEGCEAVYQPFTLVFADGTEAWTAANFEQGMQTAKLEPGLHVFSNAGAHDERSEKHTRAYDLFNDRSARVAEHSEPTVDWLARLKKVLSDHNPGGNSADPRDAICVHGELSGTVSSSIIVCSRAQKEFKAFYCPGPPCRNSFGESLQVPIGGQL